MSFSRKRKRDIYNYSNKETLLYFVEKKSMKNIANLSILFGFFVTLGILNNQQRFLVISGLIFFPMVIRFLGKDSMVISTFCIYYVFVLFLRKQIRDNESLILTSNTIIVLLVIVATISTLSVPVGDLTGPSVRKYSDFLSAILLFYIVSNLKFDDSHSKFAFIEKWLTVILIMASFQIFISLFIMKFPNYSGFLNYFTFSNEENIVMRGTKDILRIRSLIFTPESFGEFLSILGPIALYKASRKNTLFWFCIFVILVFGEILSVTRSGILLFAFGVILYLIVNYKRAKIDFWIIFLLGAVALIIGIISFYPYLLHDVIDRLNQAILTYQKTSDIALSINRAGTLQLASYAFKNINLFGHGLIPPYYYGEINYHFHNLFLTLLFQYGIIGVCLYFGIFFYVLIKIFKFYFLSTNHIKSISSAFCISLIIFLLNETKYEFNRKEAYQQLCWMFWGIGLLLTKNSYFNKSGVGEFIPRTVL